MTRTAATKPLLGAIKLYQAARANKLSPCRFYPSCSHFAYEAIETHGAVRGTCLAAGRLLRCRPFGPHGYDPVPLPTTRSLEIR